jgi:hypothetical protein
MNQSVRTVAVVVSVIGAALISTFSATGIRASEYSFSRVVRFEGGEWVAPDSASDFCKSVYEGTKDIVTILMTVPDGTEIEGTSITDHYTMISTGELVPVEACFDGDPSNDPEGNVLPIETAAQFMAQRAESSDAADALANVDCTWNGLSVEENRPGWWENEQAMFENLLLSLIAKNEPGISLEVASTRLWAPRAHMGQDVTSMELPVWMRNLIIPHECELYTRIDAYADGIKQHLTEHIEREAAYLQSWIDRNAPGLSLDEAAARFGSGARDENGDELPAPYGICAPNWWIPEALEAAGVQLPSWMSSRVIGYQESPGYPECPDESVVDSEAGDDAAPSTPPAEASDEPAPDPSGDAEEVNVVIECPEDLSDTTCTAFEYSRATGELLQSYPVARP